MRITLALLAASIIATLTVVGFGVAAADAATKVMPLCDGEDSGPSYPCMWDATHMGNGDGDSFILRRSGHVRHVTHRRAHRVWSAWQ